MTAVYMQALEEPYAKCNKKGMCAGATKRLANFIRCHAIRSTDLLMYCAQVSVKPCVKKSRAPNTKCQLCPCAFPWLTYWLELIIGAFMKRQSFARSKFRNTTWKRPQGHTVCARAFMSQLLVPEFLKDRFVEFSTHAKRRGLNIRSREQETTCYFFGLSWLVIYITPCRNTGWLSHGESHLSRPSWESIRISRTELYRVCLKGVIDVASKNSPNSNRESFFFLEFHICFSDCAPVIRSNYFCFWREISFNSWTKGVSKGHVLVYIPIIAIYSSPKFIESELIIFVLSFFFYFGTFTNTIFLASSRVIIVQSLFH